MNYIGIDLGTSSIKGLLVNEKGKILNEASYMYDVSYPAPNYSEQNPEDWIKGLRFVLNKLSDNVRNTIGGISFGGQMHGLVILDENDNVIRPCILWNDGRTEEETKYLNEVIGKKKLSDLTANIAFAGFTAPKLLWLAKNEPENFAKINKIMLPKDYLVYYLTGKFVTDYSDASGTLFYDVKNKKWSDEMCDICGIKPSQLPQLCSGLEVVGKVREKFNLPNAIVSAGAGDNAAAAIGTGTIFDGSCNISLGTSGTVFISADKFAVDKNNSLHSFAHTTGKYSLMGCILSAASANKWWLEDILSTDDYAGSVRGMDEKLGENTIYFLPYLSGERSPHNDVNARGAFVGLAINSTSKEMSLAVLEGVSFALRDCVEIARSEGIVIPKSTLCGGGAKSALWQKILANILNMDICLLETEQGPSYGGAMLAMVANKEYATIEDAVNALVKVRKVIKPDPILVEKYERKYQTFKKIYPNIKDIYKIL